MGKVSKDRIIDVFRKRLGLGNGSDFTPPKRKEETSKNGFPVKPIASSISALVGLEYKNSDDKSGKDKITIRRLWQQGDEIIVDGFSHTKNAPRMYKVSHIKQIVDLNTNEVYLQPKKFLLGQVAMIPGEEIAGFSGTAHAINRLRYELAALIFLANVDGQFANSELVMVKNYVKSKNTDLQINDEKLDGYVSRLYPDEDNFFEAIDYILSQKRAQIGDFMEFFTKLILADGVVDSNEKEFLAELLEILQEEGIEINAA
ncbi:MAG: TerB family tellurite resistance protein [Alphaproteobacteria bacterium]|nr:TerB family tellurite resistance protein [Alphaproteobacteria bacterium]